jgi:hypothetical protein
MNARVAKESIEHVCNILAFFGVRALNPESFRLAKTGDDKVVGLSRLKSSGLDFFRLLF